MSRLPRVGQPAPVLIARLRPVSAHGTSTAVLATGSPVGLMASMPLPQAAEPCEGSHISCDQAPAPNRLSAAIPVCGHGLPRHTEGKKELPSLFSIEDIVFSLKE